MSDYQSIIDRIQTAINISDSTPVETLNVLSQDYAKLCQMVNHRLADCNKFLQAGNLSEAARLADTTPHLLDLCNLIEFPELNEWNDICRTYKLTVPPAVKATVIEQLNSGLELMFSLEPLLKRHRFLALTRAPLKERLDVLYQLAEQEPENLIWTDVIFLFEQERIKEIQANIDVLPDALSSLHQLKEILQELQSSPWRDPPTNLINLVLQKTQLFTQQDSIQRLKEIALLLEEAFQKEDLRTAQSLLAKWKNLLGTGRVSELSIPQETGDLQRNVQRWVEDCLLKEQRFQAYQQKIAQFQTLLTSEDDLNTLAIHFDDLIIMASELNLSVPDVIQNTYEAKIQGAKKKKQLILICIAVAVFLFLALIIFLVCFFGRQRVLPASQKEKIETANQYLINYESAVGQTDSNSSGTPNDLLEAEELYQELIQENVQIVEMDELGKRLEDLQKQEKARVVLFQENIQKARQSLGLNRPDQKALNLAKKNALTKEDQSEILGLEKEFVGILEAQKTKELSEFREKYNPLFQKVESLRKNQENLSEDSFAEIEELFKEIELLPNSSAISEIQKSRTDLITQLNNIKNQIVEKKQLKKKFEHFQEICADLAQYYYDLEKFVDEFPRHYLSNDFNQILSQADASLRILEWNDLVEKYQDSHLSSGNVFLASLPFIRHFETVSSFFEPTEEIQTILKKIEIVRPYCDSEKRQMVRKMIQKFLSLYQKELWLIRRTVADQVQFYYFSEMPTKLDQLSYCGNSDGKMIPLSDAITPLELQSVHFAPQYLWAKDSLELLNAESLKNENDLIPYYQTLVQILKNLYSEQENDEFDPIVKLILTKKILTIYSQDPFFQACFQWGQQLNSSGFNDEINWFDPNARTINEQRKFAQELLTNWDGWNDYLERLMKQSEIFALTLDEIYQPVGFLFKENRWSCRMTKSLDKLNGELYIAINNPKTQLIEMGHLTQGIASLSDDQHLFLQGAPVFLKRKINEDNQ